LGHFQSKSVFELIPEHTRLLRESVFGMEEAMLLRPAEDVVDEVVDDYRLSVPTLYQDRKEVVERGELHGSPGGVRVVLAVPLDGQVGLFSIRPSRHLMVPFDGTVRDGELRITITQRAPTKESIESEIEQQLSRYEGELSQLREDVRPFNDGLAQSVAELVSTRRDQLLRAQDLLASLEIPVRRRADAVIPVPVTRRVKVVRRAPQAGERFMPEAELPNGDYEEILRSCRSLGIQMERSPGTFSSLAEEGIRDFFLAELNGTFHGEAMAEVFNGAGKTDILIRSGERNVFIAECKVWDGGDKFKTAVDQLLGNLGWRDTKCAILLFVRQRSVSEILEKADVILREHSCHKRPAEGHGELERRYIFHWPGDDRRELALALQVSAVPASSGKRTHRRTLDSGT
jgi:hypothetical protein